MYLKIARVFPRRTKATPDDPLAFTGPPPKGGLPDMEEVHVSVAFTYDMEKACQLAEQWMKLGIPVHMGGPAFNMLPGTGKQVIVQHYIPFGDRQFPKPSAFPPGDGTEPAAVGAAP